MANCFICNSKESGGYCTNPSCKRSKKKDGDGK